MKDDKKVSHILQLYLQWPVFLTALVILAGAAVNLISRKAGLVMLAFTVIYAACAGTLYMYGKKRALGSLVSFASAYSWSQKQLLASLELPYAVADTDGKILWMNRAFEAVTKEEKSAGKSLPREDGKCDGSPCDLWGIEIPREYETRDDPPG